MGIISLEKFLEAKGVEYAPFDPSRAKQIYQKLSAFLKNKSRKIHIVGTNAKGSTGRFIALGLIQAGFKVMHFTSPHIFRFNERFYKDGSEVTDEELEKAHHFLQQFDFIQSCSYFEYATFLAMILSEESDFLVLEAGLGGEYDSTSCLDREISVFTPISFDHQEILGKTLEEIATTKLKSMVSVAFLAPQPYALVNEIAKNIAKKLHSTLYFLPSTPSKKALEYAHKHNLASFLAQNFECALNVLQYLGILADPLTFPKLDLIGRCQQIAPNITIDVGHNEQAAHEIAKNFSSKKVILVYNTYKQKDVDSILKILKPIVKKVLIIEVCNERILEEEKLKQTLSSLDIEFEHFKPQKILSEEYYLVFGSFSVVKQFLEESSCKINL